MPLDIPGLQADILDILDEQATREQDPAAARAQFAQALAVAISKHIKTGTVTTVGSATTQTGTIQ